MGEILTAIALLLVPVLAEYMKVRAKSVKAFNLIAAGGLLTVLSAALAVLSNPVIGLSVVTVYLGLLLDVIAFILVLIGTLMAAAQLVK
jgi:hypothetical protein